MKKYFEHKLPTDNIVVRQDEHSSSTHIETISGLNYPVIRIKDTVIEYANINSLNLNINSNILPVLTISINDSDYNQRDNNFIQRDDVLTIAIGNLKDNSHNIIKNNYYITHADNSRLGTYSITGVLNVPGLYVGTNRVFVNKSSVEVLKFIAEEVGLGYISNIDESNDEMDWIQYQSSIDFIEFIKLRMWVSESSKIEIFIDQFANLNVIDVNKAIADEYKTTFITDLEGNILDEDSEFKASNLILNDEELFASIDGYAPINNSGFYSRRFPEEVDVDTFNMLTKSKEHVKLKSNKGSLKAKSIFTSYSNDNSHDNYEAAKVKNIYTSNIYDQLKLRCEFDNYYPQIFIYQTMSIDIWNLPKVVNKDNQDEDVTISEVEYEEPKEKSLSYSKNDKTGNYTVIGFSISYVYNDLSKNMIKQNLVMIRN